MFFLTPNPIPSQPDGHAIGGEEVVPGSSDLTVDRNPAVGAGVDFVPKEKTILPGTTIGACLGGAGFSTLVDEPPGFASGSVGQALTKEPMGPHVQRPRQLGTCFAISLLHHPTSLQYRSNDDVVMFQNKIGCVIVSCLHVAAYTLLLTSQLSAEHLRHTLSFAVSFAPCVRLLSLGDEVSRGFDTTGNALAKLVNATTHFCEDFTSSRKQLPELPRSRRIPLLERRAPRIKGGDALVLELRIRVRRNGHVVNPDKVEGVANLIPLNYGGCVKLSPSIHDLLNDS